MQFLRRLSAAIGLPKNFGRQSASSDEDFEQQNHKKIFGIGYNKTGSTSLEEVFRRMGYSAPVQAEQELTLTRQVQRGDYKALSAFVSRYEAFQDMPFSQDMTFVACDVLFPGSKFILTVRDADDWFRSLLEYHQRVFGFEAPSAIGEEFFKGKKLYLDKDYAYENKLRMVQRLRGNALLADWSLLYDKEHYTSIYLNRNREILSYFQHRPNDLLVIDITQESDTRRICEFLGRDPDEAISMPHKNKT